MGSYCYGFLDMTRKYLKDISHYREWRAADNPGLSKFRSDLFYDRDTSMFVPRTLVYKI